VKKYGSVISMNLHIKRKHGGGNQIDRLQYIASTIEGRIAPKDVNLPEDIKLKIKFLQDIQPET
jgi:hypothetical protein